jgi:hypothetical protein
VLICLLLKRLCFINKAVKRQPLNQAGFIPMLLTILFIVVAVVYFAYSRVLKAQN